MQQQNISAQRTLLGLNAVLVVIVFGLFTDQVFKGPNHEIPGTTPWFNGAKRLPADVDYRELIEEHGNEHVMPDEEEILRMPHKTSLRFNFGKRDEEGKYEFVPKEIRLRLRVTESAELREKVQELDISEDLGVFLPHEFMLSAGLKKGHTLHFPRRLVLLSSKGLTHNFPAVNQVEEDLLTIVSPTGHDFSLTKMLNYLAVRHKLPIVSINEQAAVLFHQIKAAEKYRNSQRNWEYRFYVKMNNSIYVFKTTGILGKRLYKLMDWIYSISAETNSPHFPGEDSQRVILFREFHGCVLGKCPPVPKEHCAPLEEDPDEESHHKPRDYMRALLQDVLICL
ncbi:MAG: hypothetical protein AAF206_07080 [Bacteroidota bacterium]